MSCSSETGIIPYQCDYCLSKTISKLYRRLQIFPIINMNNFFRETQITYIKIMNNHFCHSFEFIYYIKLWWANGLVPVINLNLTPQNLLCFLLCLTSQSSVCALVVKTVFKFKSFIFNSVFIRGFRCQEI